MIEVLIMLDMASIIEFAAMLALAENQQSEFNDDEETLMTEKLVNMHDSIIYNAVNFGRKEFEVSEDGKDFFR